MEQTNMERTYQKLIQETDQLLEENPGVSRLEAFGESLLYVEGEGSFAERRKAFQFAYLYQVQKEQVQPNHQLTPDTIGYMVAHLIQLFGGKSASILDAGSGTGHLAMTVKEQAENAQLSGIEVDPVLARLNANLCEFLEVPMDIYPQDIIEPARLNQVDAAIGDLPVGYYPIEVDGFTTAFKKGKSYSHLLMLESAMTYVKDDGIGVFVVPDNMLEKDNETIKQYLSESATLLMFLNLPKSIFKTENQRKSIIVVKKNFSPLKNNEVLIGDVPDFKNTSQFKHFLEQTESWYDNYTRN
ncbi:class I SAM-dependent methyltransferase [Salinicoccus hispanicus]|uniref:N-6 DNA methylase n=1 Tax=Salinicoccus hispanicus TaxID=157225 RepID=A0A6N8TXK5_9STAP|nr:class I SAM-dependent methyltransferase [Salinicoccus hispanicus]MXQ50460.1 N-6 DNA methylase [Salinicoccus hispanicus]